MDYSCFNRVPSVGLVIAKNGSTTSLEVTEYGYIDFRGEKIFPNGRW
jgi:hypothetical protein